MTPKPKNKKSPPARGGWRVAAFLGGVQPFLRTRSPGAGCTHGGWYVVLSSGPGAVENRCSGLRNEPAAFRSTQKPSPNMYVYFREVVSILDVG